MNDGKVFVGLDYHQASVQVCVMEPAGKMLANRRCPNERRAIVKTAEIGRFDRFRSGKQLSRLKRLEPAECVERFAGSRCRVGESRQP